MSGKEDSWALIIATVLLGIVVIAVAGMWCVQLLTPILWPTLIITIPGGLFLCLNQWLIYYVVSEVEQE